MRNPFPLGALLRGSPASVGIQRRPSASRSGVLIAWTLLTAGGCVRLDQVSSGQVGCPPQDIQIVDERTSWGGRTWTAVCQDRRYFCSAFGGGEGAAVQVACTPEGGPTGGLQAQPPESAGPGCQYDTQCKGDRLCVEGRCVAPSLEVPQSPPPPSPGTEDPQAEDEGEPSPPATPPTPAS